jgi:hypothetical protein
MEKDVLGMFMVGFGIFPAEMRSLNFDTDHYVPLTLSETRILFRRRTLPAFTVAVYNAEVMPHISTMS